VKEILNKTKMKLLIRSPVHIGSVEQKLTPFDYIEHNGYIFHVSEEKLSEFLLKRKLLDIYLSSVQREGHRFRIGEFLNKNMIIPNESELMKLCGGRKTRILENNPNFTDFRPFIRDGIGKVFIPGSAIKGVIRTSILYIILKRLKENNYNRFKKTILDRIERTEAKQFKKRNPFFWIQKSFLQNFPLLDKRGTPHTDFLRVLHISDAYPQSDIETNLIDINIIKRDGNRWNIKRLNSGKRMVIWVEAIPEESVWEFEIIFDSYLFEKFKENYNEYFPQNMEDILSCINEWSSDIKKFEQSFFMSYREMNWYETNEEINFRIGFGSGMISTTIAMLLPEDLRKKIRNLTGKNKGDEIAPKSRHVWIRNGQIIPLGWCHLLKFNKR